MKRIDPGSLSLIDWQIESICRDLAAMIADQAVENPAAIPDRLLAAYHDALQAKVGIRGLVKSVTDTAMEEVTTGSF